MSEDIVAQNKRGSGTKIIKGLKLFAADLFAGVDMKLFTPKNSTDRIDPVLLINLNIKEQALLQKLLALKISHHGIINIPKF